MYPSTPWQSSVRTGAFPYPCIACGAWYLVALSVTQYDAVRCQVNVVPGQSRILGPCHCSRWPDGREMEFLLEVGSIGHTIGREHQVGGSGCVLVHCPAPPWTRQGTPSPEALASLPSNPGFLPTGIFIALLLRFDIR